MSALAYPERAWGLGPVAATALRTVVVGVCGGAATGAVVALGLFLMEGARQGDASDLYGYGIYAVVGACTGGVLGLVVGLGTAAGVLMAGRLWPAAVAVLLLLLPPLSTLVVGPVALVLTAMPGSSVDLALWGSVVLCATLAAGAVAWRTRDWITRPLLLPRSSVTLS